MKQFTFKLSSRIFIIYSLTGYIIADLCEISGVICILVCAIISGYYGIHNLTPEAQTSANHTFQFIGEASEGLVFCYLGVTANSYDLFSVPFGYLFALFFSAVAARFVGTFGLCYFVSLVSNGKFYIGVKNMSILWIGGIVRGVISFALALTLTGLNSEIIQIVILSFIIVGTLILGTVLPLWVKFMNVQEPNVSLVQVNSSASNTNWFIRRWVWVNENYIKKLIIRPKPQSINATIWWYLVIWWQASLDLILNKKILNNKKVIVSTMNYWVPWRCMNYRP